MAEYDKAVPPGGEGKIVIKVNTKGYQGQVLKTAQVRTNDPLQENFPLRMKADVKVPIYLSSRYVYLTSNKGGTATRDLEIRAELEKPLTIEPVSFDLEKYVTYTIEEVEKGKKFKLTFSATPEVTQDFQGSLKLKTNYPEKPEILLRIRGRIRDIQVPSVANAIKMSKPLVFLRGVEGKPMEESVDLEAVLDKPLELKPADFTLEGKVTYRIEELEKAKKYRIHFACEANEQGRFAGQLKLKTNYTEVPELVVHVRGMVFPERKVQQEDS